MYRHSIALLIAMMLHGGLLWAWQSPCDISVRISLVETHNNQPVAAALIQIEELHLTTQSDEKGLLRLGNVCPGTYHFHLSAPGYDSVIQELNITAPGAYTLKMSHCDHVLNGIVVTEKKHQSLLQSKTTIYRDEIMANSGKTFSELLQSVNGVSLISNGATISKPVIHGMHSNRIMILNNGVRQEDQQWGGEHAPGIDPFLASSITVIKGAAGVRYGTDAIGGVIMAEPAPLRKSPGTDAEVNLAAFSNNRMGVASATVQHAFKGNPAWAFRLQGTFRQGGNYQVPGGYWVANTGTKEVNYSATLGFRKAHYGGELFYSHFNTGIGVYRGSHTGSREDLMNAINSPYPLVPAAFSYDIGRPRQHVLHDLVKARVYTDSKLGTWSLVYAYQHNFRQEYDVMRIDDGQAQLNLTLNTQTLNLNLDHKAMGHFSGSVGIDAMYQDNFFRNGDRVFIPSYTSVGLAGYAIERYKKRATTLEAGLRYDYKYYDVFNPEGTTLKNVQYQFDFSNISATTGVHTVLKNNMELGLTLASAWRAPQANELFSAGLHQGAARIEIGNKDLKPEKAFNVTADVKYPLAEWISTDVSLYSQLVSDYIYLKPAGEVLTIRGYYKQFDYTQTNALIAGADVSANLLWSKHFRSQLKASVVRGRDRTSDDWLILMPSDRYSGGLRYEFNASRSFQECFAGISARYVARQWRVPSNFDVIDYPRPPADYYTVDAEAGTRWRFGKQSLYFSLSVSNLFNRKYREYLDAFRYYLDQPGTNVVVRLRLPIQF